MKIIEKTVERTLKTIELSTGYINNHLLIHTISNSKKIKLRFSLRLLFETLGSMLMIFILIVPGSLGGYTSSNEVLKYITENNWLIALYITVVVSVTFLISSKFGVSSSYFSLAHQVYKGQTTYFRSWIIFFFQLLGAFAASFAMWAIANNLNLFHKAGEIIEGAPSLGSSLSAPIPFIKGFANKWSGPGHTPELWLYSTQAAVSGVFIILIFWLYRLSYQVNGKQTALWTLVFKVSISFVLIYITSHTYSHITNPSRIISVSITSQLMGGYQNTITPWTLFITTLVFYQISMMLPSDSRANWKKWLKPEEFKTARQKALIDINLKKSEEY